MENEEDLPSSKKPPPTRTESTAQDLSNAALSLHTDSLTYQRYSKDAPGKTAAARRQQLRKHLKRLSSDIFGKPPPQALGRWTLADKRLDTVALEYIRRYLDSAWELPPPAPHSGSGYDLEGLPDVDVLDYVEPEYPKLAEGKTLKLQVVWQDALARVSQAEFIKHMLGEPWEAGEGLVIRESSGFKRGKSVPFHVAALDEPSSEIGDCLAYAFSAFLPPTPTPSETYLKEITMNTKDIPQALNITTQTLVNGVDVATLSKDQIYGLIAGQEARIKDLEALKNKPKALAREIEERQLGINKLVAYLDSLEPVLGQLITGTLESTERIEPGNRAAPEASKHD